MGEIQHPACGLVVEKDILKPPHDAETIASRIPNAHIPVLPGAGHASFWESAETFNRIQLDFLGVASRDASPVKAGHRVSINLHQHVIGIVKRMGISIGKINAVEKKRQHGP